MKRLTPLLLLSLLSPLMAACTITQAQADACYESGGVVVSRPFRLGEGPPTQHFTYCETQGLITEVYTTEEGVAAPEAFEETCGEGHVHGQELKEETRKGEKVEVTYRKRSFICLQEGYVTSSLVEIEEEQ